MSAEITVESSVLRADGSALMREWLCVNHLGGYASSTLAGANTRRYHGLLVAALQPPLGRAVLLSKLEETLEITLANGTTHQFPLSVNLYQPDIYYPQGNQMLNQWQLLPTPTWTWEPLPGLLLQKRIWMMEGFNATCVEWTLLKAPRGSTVHLQVVPLLAWRDYHSTMAACTTQLPASWNNSTLALTLPPIQNACSFPTSLQLRFSNQHADPLPDVSWSPRPDWYYHFQYPREAERGFSQSEDLYNPGVFRALLTPKQPLVVTAAAGTMPSVTPQSSMQMLVNRQEALQKQQHDVFSKQLALAADAFVVHTQQTRTTLLAGFPWFSDWGRDTMIALPGICLAAGRTELASEILREFARHVDAGMLPNRFPDSGQTPEYNTVDATLWYFVAIWHTLQARPDNALAHSLWPVLQQIVQAHQQGTRYNIHVDSADSLLYAGEQGVQLTWMDAKTGDHVVTPRIGKPVEINALWYNALCIMEKLAEQLGKQQESSEYASLAQQTAQSFQNRFARTDGKGLYDVLDVPGGGQDASIRPNQVFAVSLPFSVIPPTGELAGQMLQTIQQHLLTPCGLRTLSPEDPAYQPRYCGDSWQRDGAYHQGTVWPWLLGPYAEAYAKCSQNNLEAAKILLPIQNQLAAMGMGTICEIYDGGMPQRPNGCFAQAWSVAETLRVWKLLTGDTHNA